MFVRKDSVRTIEQYIDDCEQLKRTMPLQADTINDLIYYAEYLRKKPVEYIWVQRL